MAAPRQVRSLLTSLTQSIPSKKQTAAYICQPCLRSLSRQQIRTLHQHVKAAPVPKPTPFVPDVSTFLTLIGRKLSLHSSKFTTWESLFKLTSPQLKELGIEPARTRRYLLRWRDKFRKGEHGIGGDLQYVSEDGVGELRIVEVPSLYSSGSESQSDSSASISHTPGITKLIVNVPNGKETYELKDGQTTKDLKKPKFIKLKDGHVIVGSHIQPVKGSNGSVATLKVAEGLWEDKRGHKIYGGERRRAETLHKMRVAERKKNER